MNIKRTLIAGILMVTMIFFSTAAFATTVEEYAHGELAYAHLEFIDENLPQRIAFSPRELETAQWLVYTLINMGHSPDNIYMQKFSAHRFTHGWINFMYAPSAFDEETEEWYMAELDLLEYSQNVILTVPGISDRKIIVGAHYDSVDNNGISDNASGTVLLLESAQRMLYLEHYYTIVYVFFGAEEIGLYGSAYYLASLTDEERENIVLMVNVDVIFDGSVLTYAAGFHDSEASAMGSNAVSLLIDEIAERLNEELDLGLVRDEEGIYTPSDHLPFVFAGFNVVAFYAVHNAERAFSNIESLMTDFLYEQMTLIEAMVLGTDDPQLIEAINERREDLEQTLWWNLHNEGLYEWLEFWEMEIEGLRGFFNIERTRNQIEGLRRVIAVLEHPKMEEFEFKYEFWVPIPFEETLLLIEAMVVGTDDPELMEEISKRREHLERVLAWDIRIGGVEWLLESIERMEQEIKEEDDPDNIEWLMQSIRYNKKMIAILELPELEEFVFKYEDVSEPMPIELFLLLLEAMVFGTDDPELIEAINEEREVLEGGLAWNIYRGIELLEEDIEWRLGEIERLERNIERLEQNKEENYALIKGRQAEIEMWQGEIEGAKGVIAILERPEMENFVFQYEFDFSSDVDTLWIIGGEMTQGYVIHTPNDNLTFINENWPGLIERSLRAYSIFLENILTLPSQSLELAH